MNKKIPAGKYTVPLDQLIVIYMKQVAIVTVPLLTASLGMFYGLINTNNEWYIIFGSIITIMMFIIAKLYIDEKVEKELRKLLEEKYYVGDNRGK